MFCCWVVIYFNVGFFKDKVYYFFIDRVYLVMVGLLGLEFLLVIVLGQFLSVRWSVRVVFLLLINFCVRCEIDDICRNLGQMRLLKVCNGILYMFFFMDIGVMFFISFDYLEGFFINVEQFYYFVKYGYVDFLDMELMKIGERNVF